MPSFSQSSAGKLDTAIDRFQRLFNKVIQEYDNTILQGWRSSEEQLSLFNEKRSKVKQGKHNESPSRAIDSAPYLSGRGIPWPKTPDDWNNKDQRNSYIKDLAQFYHYAGYVQGVAFSEGIPVRWGGDWDRDHDLSDQTFDDLVHFEDP